MNFIKKLHPAVKGLVLVMILAAGAFAYWLVSPLFYNVEVSEAIAVDAATANTFTTLASGNFKDADSFHKAAGVVNVVNRGEDVVVRFEEAFETTNGPDLFVWLVKGDNVDNGYIDLGRLKGNKGSQNYTLPQGVELSEYNNVFIWCKAFGVLFGSAELALN